MQYSRFPDSLPDGRAPVIRTGFLPPTRFVGTDCRSGCRNRECVWRFEYANICFI